MDYKTVKLHAVVLCLYTLMTAVLTFPVVLHMKDGLAIGDPSLNTWAMAWNAHSILTDPLNLFNANIFYPFTENSLALSEHLFANNIVSLPIIILTDNPILAYNAVFLISFILSGFGMFLLVHYHTEDRYSAFLAGTAFAFCVVRFSHLGHLQLLSVQWTPLALLYLDKFLWRSNFKNFILFWLFYILQILSSWYSAVYITITVTLYLIYYFFRYSEVRKLIADRDFLYQTAIFILLTIVVMIPFSLPYIHVAQEYGFIRSISESELFSADVMDYFLTPPNNMLYGDFSKPIQEGRNWGEHSLFPGLMVIILSIYGLLNKNRPGIKTIKQTIYQNKYSAKGCFLLIGVVAFVMSLGPYFYFFGQNTGIPLPYKFFYETVPIFGSMRVPSRFGIIVMLSLSVLAGYGLAKLLRGLNTNKKIIISSLFTLFIILESLYIPLGVPTIQTGEDIPEIYRWLGQEEGEFAVVELPTGYFTPDGNNLHYDTKYMYFSTYHWKKLVNGYSGFFPPYYIELLHHLQSFPSDESITRLEDVGVRYVIIHSAEIKENEWDNIKNSLENYKDRIEFVNKCGQDYVYRILRHSNISTYSMKNWHPPEIWEDIPTRWMTNDATILIISDGDRTVDLSFNALSFYRPRTLDIYINDQPHIWAEVSNEGFQTVNVPRIKLNEGANIVRFEVPEECERPCDIPELNNPDSRCLSLAIQDVKITEDILINDLESLSISLGTGWHGLEDWGDTPTRWMENDATLIIESEENRTTELSFQVKSFYRPRTLETYARDALEMQEVINASGFAAIKMPVHLKEGTNIMRFYVPEGCERPCDIPQLKNPDGRCLSLAFQDIMMS